MTRLVERFIYLTWKHIALFISSGNFLQSCFADLLMYVTQFFEKTGQVIFHPIGAREMNGDVMNQSRLKGFKNSLELTIGRGQKVTKQRTGIAK